MFLPLWYKEEINKKLQLLYNVVLFEKAKTEVRKRKQYEENPSENVKKKPCLDNDAGSEENKKCIM